MEGGPVGLWGLFASAFLAATLLPGGSEVVLAYLAGAQHYSPFLLLTVASAGNILGGMSSWLIGRLIPSDRLERPDLAPAVARVRRHGGPALLLSWVPFVGDPLCVAAGWLRVSWYRALAYIAVGKVARYLVVLMAARGSLG